MATVINKDGGPPPPEAHLVPPRRIKTLDGGTPPTLPAPTITITALSPNTAPRNTNQTTNVLGTGLTPNDVITYGTGKQVPTRYIYGAQVSSYDPVFMGTIGQTVQVWLTRGAEVSNQLPFTMT